MTWQQTVDNDGLVQWHQYASLGLNGLMFQFHLSHYDDVIMTTMASQITSLTVVYSIVDSDADQRKHQSSASLAFVWGIHRDRWISRTKGQLRGKCFHLMTSPCECECRILTIHSLATWRFKDISSSVSLKINVYKHRINNYICSQWQNFVKCHFCFSGPKDASQGDKNMSCSVLT